MPAPRPVTAASLTDDENLLSGAFNCPTRKPPACVTHKAKCIPGSHARVLMKCSRTQHTESLLPVCLADLFLSHLAKTGLTLPQSTANEKDSVCAVPTVTDFQVHWEGLQKCSRHRFPDWIRSESTF